jgi:hypothetical protein
LLVLATDANDVALKVHGDLLRDAFPNRARAMHDVLAGAGGPGRGIALIDPTHRGHRWLLPASVDARRIIRRPFRGYNDAAAHVRSLARR